MKRFVFIRKIKPEKVEKYKESHRHLWPEMLAAIKADGIGNYSLFMRDDGLVVGYGEQADGAPGGSEEVKRRWREAMAPLQDDSVPWAGGAFDEIFHVE